jgi:hypothetical protein
VNDTRAKFLYFDRFFFFEIFVTVPDKPHHADVARNIFRFLAYGDRRKATSGKQFRCPVHENRVPAPFEV